MVLLAFLVSLVLGWNLIAGTDQTPHDLYVESTCTDVTVYHYDADDGWQRWVSNTSYWMNDITYLDPDKGYWVHCASDGLSYRVIIEWHENDEG
jgi:hypothetical protein